ncbi:MAG: methyltransferase domain-containing protein [Alphaproteobacteria bacterium]
MARVPLGRALRAMVPRRVRRSLGERVTRARVKTDSVLADPLQLRRPALRRSCPICDYRGRFWSFGVAPRPEALCPSCFSLERHRLFHLLLLHHGRRWLAGKRVLHFAPEGAARPALDELATCVTADIAGDSVDCRCGMEAMPFPDRSFDAVIANHVLEHVEDDLRAMRELRRVIRTGGVAILSVPVIQGWERTYENGRVQSPDQRRIHFGQADHRRFYGRDFTARLEHAGLTVDRFQMDPPSEIAFGLRRGDCLFVARPR